MEKAMYYEMIIRKANNDCGRYGFAGADADIFRGMERVYCINHNGKFEHSEFERGLHLGMVTAYLMDAIERLIKSEKYNEKTTEALQECYDALIHPTLEVVDNNVDKVSSLIFPH